jgi:methylated-DNA-protein-cysteine methyltransferase-like protein
LRKREQSFFAAVHRAVRSIPRGRVRTYGQVALMVGRPGAARQVGWALHMLPEGEAERQRARLEAEGVEFDESGRIELGRYH